MAEFNLHNNSTNQWEPLVINSIGTGSNKFDMARLISNENNIATNTASINTINGKIATNEGRIITLESAKTDHETQITSNTNRIGTLETVKTDHQNRLVILENYTAHLYAETGVVVSANPSELQQLPINSNIVKNNRKFALGINEVYAQEEGMYFIDIRADWSGMNQGVLGEVFIRRFEPNNVYGDYGFQARGALGHDAWNGGGFITQGSIIVNLGVGGKLQFLARHYDTGPRQVKQAWIKVFKISKI